MADAKLKCPEKGCKKTFRTPMGLGSHLRVHGIEGKGRKALKLKEEKARRKNNKALLQPICFCPFCGNQLPNAHIRGGV